MPTVEEMLWRAMMKAYLILPEAGSRTGIQEGEVTWEGCEYSKCGRTDRGVSAFGQVIGIRLRSNRPPDLSPGAEEYHDNDLSELNKGEGVGSDNVEIHSQSFLNEDLLPSTPSSQDAKRDELYPVEDEIPYIQILNRLLPPDIRLLAWCPSPPPGFNARFSCKERRYKYFFTQPAFAPTRSGSGFKHSTLISDGIDPRREGWLNIEAMREAAKKFEGLHDFRNFCRVDASKQMESFERKIFYAGIEELPPDSGPARYIAFPGFQERKSQTPNGFPDDTVASSESSTPKIYTFTLHGSGFLWHQVRYMVAILFRIGQGLESSDLIDVLLDIHQTPEKPMYDMAEDAPLVLWDCIFPREGGNPHKDGLDWVYASDSLDDTQTDSRVADKKQVRSGRSKHGPGDVVDDLWKLWRGRKIDEVLAGKLLDVVAGQGNPPPPFSIVEHEQREDDTKKSETQTRNSSQKIFLGGDAARPAGQYIPVLAKPRRAKVEVLNARYAARKGFEQDPRARERGFRSMMPGSEGGEEAEGEKEADGEGEEEKEEEEEDVPA